MARPRVNFVHPLLRARDYQNRPEFDRLCDWWRRSGQGVCALVGIGGAGKTAVADRFLRVLPGAMADDPNLPKDDTLSEPGGVFIFSFYDAPSPDKFIAELAAWLEDRPPDDRATTYSSEQTIRLLQGAGDCLLVLDGLEKVQDPGLRGGAFGEITDGRLRDFVLRLAEGCLPGVRAIITTRFRPYDPLAERSPLYWPIPVEQLDPRAAVALLRRRGVRRGTDNQLEAVARDQGLHALSVDLAGGYIAHFCDGDPARLPPDPHDQPAAAADAALDPRIAAIRKQERKFARLAERYTEALAQSDPAAVALLQRVCLFRLGVDARTLASIFTGEGRDEISGPELAKLSFEELAGKLQKLAAMRLIEVSGAEKREDPSVELGASSFSIHPAVRGGFLAGLDAETAQRGHNAAREGLTASLGGIPGSVTNASDPATLDLLEEIVYHTLAADHANDAWHIYRHRMGGYRNLGHRLGAYQRGERICRAFAAGRAPQTAPLADGLPEHRQASFINEWALYLIELGRLDAAARCFGRGNESPLAQENLKHASTGHRNLADALVLAGRLMAGLRSAEEALRLAERADDAEGRYKSHAYRGHARALCGDTNAALADFRDVLYEQHKAEGKTDRPLWNLPGIWHSVLLVRLAQHEKATRLTEANRNILCENFGEQHHDIPKCDYILADLARERGDLPGARKRLAEALDWAIAHDAKESLCWSALVRAKIELSRGRCADQSKGADTSNGPHSGPYDEARAAIKDGLRIARDCGFGIFHIDLLMLRVQVALHEGRAVDAERDVRLALDQGVQPPAESGLPELLAATDKECGYAWGIAEARHLLAEALLLRAAQKLGSRTYKPRSRKTPPDVRKLITSARAELQKCARLRKRIQDPKQKDTQEVLDRLNDGVLTNYPLEPAPVEDTPRGPVTEPPQDDPDETGIGSKSVAKKHVFLSYCRDNATEVAKLRDDLIAAGEAVWWDRDILPGEDWKFAIRQAMKDCYAVVLCVSMETEARATSGIFPEALDAIAAYREYAPGGIFLIPVRLSSCEIPPFEIDGTRTLDRLQYVDLFPAAQRSAGLQRLIQSLQATPHHP